MDVIVELWGPMSDSRAYTWIPVGKIDADSLDIDYLKGKAVEIINNLEWKSTANMARLRVVKNGKDEMKITLEDL